jgi:hypothetical protein
MSNCWVIVERGTSLAPEPVRHYRSQGDAVDAIKRQGPVAILTLAAGELAAPCAEGGCDA